MGLRLIWKFLAYDFCGFDDKALMVICLIKGPFGYNLFLLKLKTEKTIAK